MTCVEEQPQCVAVGETCGGPGQRQLECCGGAQCQTLLGGSSMTCVEEEPHLVLSSAAESYHKVRNSSELSSIESLKAASAYEQCIDVGEICGGPDMGRPGCCSGAVCQSLDGEATMICVLQQPEELSLLENESSRLEAASAHCKYGGETCGHDGLSLHDCCGHATCQSLLGGSSMVCVVEQPQCVAAGGTCGGPGQRQLECCGGAQCQTLLGGSSMTCVEEQPQCVAVGETCGGP